MKLHDWNSTLCLGKDLTEAHGAVILLHGRGGSAEDIARLNGEFSGKSLAFAAPQATGHSWYPQRFLVPVNQNEPWLSSALEVIDGLVEQFLEAGIPSDRIGLIGFSQGACLSLEYLHRHPRHYGFVAALSGALIGPLKTFRPKPDLHKTPVLLGCAAHDEHIPLPHVEETEGILSASNAEVKKIIFPGSTHAIFPEEIEWIHSQISGWK